LRRLWQYLIATLVAYAVRGKRLADDHRRRSMRDSAQDESSFRDAALSRACGGHLAF
jgi:hypothetical protein